MIRFTSYNIQTLPKLFVNMDAQHERRDLFTKTWTSEPYCWTNLVRMPGVITNQGTFKAARGATLAHLNALRHALAQRIFQPFIYLQDDAAPTCWFGENIKQDGTFVIPSKAEVFYLGLSDGADNVRRNAPEATQWKMKLQSWRGKYIALCPEMRARNIVRLTYSYGCHAIFYTTRRVVEFAEDVLIWALNRHVTDDVAFARNLLNNAPAYTFTHPPIYQESMGGEVPKNSTWTKIPAYTEEA